MFVHNVEVVQSPERLMCPSLVWFESEKSVLELLPGVLYLSIHKGFVIVRRRDTPSPNRECDVGTRWSGTPDRLIGQVVKGGSQTVGGIADAQWNESGEGVKLLEDVMDATLNTRITLGDDFVGFAPLKPSNLDLKLLDVVVGPLDLVPDGGQVLHDSLPLEDDAKEQRGSPDTGDSASI
jgi:hypothetical protein